MPPLDDLMVKIAVWVNVFMVTCIGALAQLLHRTFIDEKPLSIGYALTSIFMAFFVGLVVGSVIPPEMPARDGVLLMCGYCGIEIAQLLRDAAIKRAKKELDSD